MKYGQSHQQLRLNDKAQAMKRVTVSLCINTGYRICSYNDKVKFVVNIGF